MPSIKYGVKYISDLSLSNIATESNIQYPKLKISVEPLVPFSYALKLLDNFFYFFKMASEYSSILSQPEAKPFSLASGLLRLLWILNPEALILKALILRNPE